MCVCVCVCVCVYIYIYIYIYIYKELVCTRAKESAGILMRTDFRPVVCFLLGNSPAPEFYIPTFRDTLFHLHRQLGAESRGF